MYMWLVLSTFLAILAGYSLPLRSDTSDKVDVPVATASAMRMVVNHKVALNYLRTQKWPFKCTDCAEGEECSECEITHQTAFDPGLIDFTSEGVNSGIFEPDENYKSLVLCYNQDGTPSDDCFKEESNNRSRYLITYGDLHNKWLSFVNDTECTPEENVLRGIGAHYSPDTLIGYVKSGADGTAELIGPSGLKLFNFKADMYTEMISCNTTCDGSCIAFVNEL